MQRLSSSSSQDAKRDRKRWWRFLETRDLAKFKDLFSESADAASNLISNDRSATVMDIAKTILNGIGKAHWVAAGLAAVAFVLERFDMVLENNAECVDLLNEMYRLAQYLPILKQRGLLKQHIASLIEDALQLVVEGEAAAFFFQAKSSWWCKLFGADVERRQLEDVCHRENSQTLDVSSHSQKPNWDGILPQEGWNFTPRIQVCYVHSLVPQKMCLLNQ